MIFLQRVHGASDLNHPHTPTPSSSAAVEVTSAGSPSTPSSAFPTPSITNILDSSAVFLPQSLSELVGPPSASSSSSFQLHSSMSGGQDETAASNVVCLWDKCQQEFPSLPKLVTHLDRVHTLPMTQFVCLWEDCSRNLKPFDARYKLITHLRCHTGEKPYRCDVPSCKRSFSRLENLKLHTRTHTGEKPYQCDYIGCNKKFNNTSDRAKHKKTHVTRKPYACKYPGCGKSYTDPSSMRKHIKYTHKLKEEAERAGLSILTLPKRKRNSASSSSSSSSSSSTPHTPQAQQGPQATAVVQETTHLLQGMPMSTHSPGLLGGSSITSQPQLFPMVKIGGRVQGSQPVLLPTYQPPPPPVMMILTNSPKSAASSWVRVAPTPAESSSVQGTNNGLQGSITPSNQTKRGCTEKSILSDMQVISQAQSLSTSSPSSVEEQLRVQIAHLQQQLYQSQLAAARVTQRQPQFAVTQPPAVAKAEAPSKVNLEGNRSTDLKHTQEKTVGHFAQSQPPSKHEHHFSTTRNGLEQPTTSMLASMKTASQLRAAEATGSVSVGQVFVSNMERTPEVGAVATKRPLLPQYIPIPILPQEAATQYLYMSP